MILGIERYVPHDVPPDCYSNMRMKVGRLGIPVNVSPMSDFALRPGPECVALRLAVTSNVTDAA